MTADVTALRSAAARLEAAQAELERCARRLRSIATTLAQQWKGDAAGTALQELEGLAQQARVVAAAHAQATDVLRSCAYAVEEAQATLAQAAAFEVQDVERRERAAARGALVGPYDDAGLLRHAQALREDAQAQADRACSRAAAELRALAQRDAPGLSARDQLVGIGRGAYDAVRGSVDLVHGLLRDPRGTAGGVVEGLDHARSHPREAAVAATGWDVLQQGRYGEWAGGFLPDLLTAVFSGGAVPAGRRAADLGRRLSDLEQRERAVPARSPVPGGRVSPRPGAVMTPRYPKTIRAFSPERQRHVLVGDPPPKTGGGHAFGAGRGKSEFPESWTHELIVRRVMDTAMRPMSSRDQDGRPNLLAYAEHDGVCVQVAVSPKGKVVTGYPVTGEVAAAGCGRRSA